MIPPAEEFLELQHELVPSRDFDIRQVMIEFAKLHVIEALKEASKNSSKTVSFYNKLSEQSNIKAILNAYPLNLIK